jgi:hypothetical protein
LHFVSRQGGIFPIIGKLPFDVVRDFMIKVDTGDRLPKGDELDMLYVKAVLNFSLVPLKIVLNLLLNHTIFPIFCGSST